MRPVNDRRKGGRSSFLLFSCWYARRIVLQQSSSRFWRWGNSAPRAGYTKCRRTETGLILHLLKPEDFEVMLLDMMPQYIEHQYHFNDLNLIRQILKESGSIRKSLS